jgi:flavin-dependent dehydrogenase
MPAGVAALQRIGLTDVVAGEPFYGIRYHIQNVMAEGRFPKIRGIPAHGICQRRFYLDQALLNTASSTPHVTVHTQARVLEPYIDQDGKVIGVVTKNGPQKSQIVIAADGIHSPFRQKLGLDIPVPKQRIGFRLHYKLANTYPSPACVEVFVGKHYEIYTGLLPNNEMLLSVVAWKSAVKDRADAQIKNWIREHPTLVERLTQAEQITSIRGVFPLQARARAGIHPGAVLIGDAAGFIDPITGGGLTQAILSAELLAKHLPRELAKNNTYLTRFERERNALLREYRFITRMTLNLSNTRWLSKTAILGLRRFPQVFSHLIGVAGGIRRLLPLPALPA